MVKNRWIHTWHLAIALALSLATGPGLGAQELPAIAFTPAAPTSSDPVAADLPFTICAWTIVKTPGHIDINFILAPCPMANFTDRVWLGQLVPGTYTVTVNLDQQGITPKASGILQVAAAVDATPALAPTGLFLCMLGLFATAVVTLGKRRSRAERRLEH